MSRGDRSRPARERTPEERERDREERARRRAERAGGAGTDPRSQGTDPTPAQASAAEHEPTPPLGDDTPPWEPTPPQEPTLPQGEDTPPHEDSLPSGPIAPPQPDLALESDVPLEPHPPLESDAPLEPDPIVEHGPEVQEEEVLPSTASLELPPSSPELDQDSAQPPAPSGAPAPSDEAAQPLPAWRVQAPSPLVEHTGDERRSRAPRSALARVGAVLALAAVIAAVVLLLNSLLHKSHAKTVAAPTVVKVLIPEGKTRLEIAQIAAADGLVGSYRAAAKRSALLNPTHYRAPRGTPDLEGFLFPATYDMDPHAPVSRLVHEQLTAFVENFGVSEITRARALHVTPYQLLTIASMIEREAEVPGDRPKIAAVIYNRLHKGMPLGIDATIYYAIELRKGIPTYTGELTEAQLQINSAYNTRTHTGLPPTPISNPGLASIDAAANPAHASYLYYVAAADGCGEHVFSTTLAAFEANAAAYHAALKKNGGHLPACHKK